MHMGCPASKDRSSASYDIWDGLASAFYWNLYLNAIYSVRFILLVLFLFSLPVLCTPPTSRAFMPTLLSFRCFLSASTSNSQPLLPGYINSHYLGRKKVSCWKPKQHTPGCDSSPGLPRSDRVSKACSGHLKSHLSTFISDIYLTAQLRHGLSKKKKNHYAVVRI